MDDIEKRLKEATDICLSTHSEWSKNKKDSKTRESLMEAVHELRKVAARLEIEIAISERDEMASKPIPIPPHRSSKRKAQGSDGGDDNRGNQDFGDQDGRPARGGGGSGKPRRKTGTGPKDGA